MITRFADPEYTKDFMSITRLADAEVDGQPVAVFEFVLDYSKMFSNEQFQADFDEYMRAFMKMQGAPADEMGDDYDMMMEMMYTMFTDSEMRMQQWIDLNDFYTHHVNIQVNMNMDAGTMAGTSGENTPDSINVDMDFVLDLSAFNDPVEVAVPENAQSFDPAMFMGASSY
jgi:hypothetical protein